MSSTMRSIATAIILASSVFFVYGLPDGAPVDTCVKPSRPNEPHHGTARSRPVETSPYRFTASSSQYGPGSQITVLVCLTTYDLFYCGSHRVNALGVTGENVICNQTLTISGAPFKGFFLQGRDPDTNSWIGSWAQTENTNTHPECSAVTHADPEVKQHATLIWNAPPNARGRVYFTGTILKEYAEFWSNLVATTNH